MIGIDALRANPALLKLDLYCKGARLDGSCYVEEDGGRKILRTRAGLGSGLELILPGGLWTNVPVSERFAERSPYTLHRLPHQTTGRYLLRWNGADVAPVRLSPRPGWYDRGSLTQRTARPRPLPPRRRSRAGPFRAASDRVRLAAAVPRSGGGPSGSARRWSRSSRTPTTRRSGSAAGKAGGP